MTTPQRNENDDHLAAIDPEDHGHEHRRHQTHPVAMSAQEALDALSFLSMTARRDAAGDDGGMRSTTVVEQAKENESAASHAGRCKSTTNSNSQIPDWIEDDEAEPNGGSCESSPILSGAAATKTRTTSTPQTDLEVSMPNPVETLATDVSSRILSHLTLTELANVSLVSKRLHAACRTNALWKLLLDGRWKFTNAPQNNNWYLAYQEAYHNPHDLWITHWNCVFPNDGLAPGRCCILVDHDTKNNHGNEHKPNKEAAVHCRNKICPTCRYFPQHPLRAVEDIHKDRSRQQLRKDRKKMTLAEAIADVTDQSILAFHNKCQHKKGFSSMSALPLPSYSSQQAQRAFENAATFHRSIDTRQYAAVPPSDIHDHQPSSACDQSSTSTTVAADNNTLVFLKDLLFFNVTEEPYGTLQGMRDTEHLLYERQHQVDFETNERSSSSATGPGGRPPRRQRQPAANQADHNHDNAAANDRRNQPTHQEWLKPANETAHHSWHTVLVTNPDHDRPVVFRTSVQRPDCFVVFPSEGYLEPGQSVVVVFGVRPLGSLLATAMERVNVEREGVDPELFRVFQEEPLLPVAPFLIQYKYSSLVPCVPAHGGFVPPYRPQWRRAQEAERSNNGARPTHQQVPSVAEICWQQKEVVDYHWSGLSGQDRPAVVVESHEVRSIYLSAHVNAHYPLWQFSRDTLTPFAVAIKPTATTASDNTFPTPMMYYNAPHLYEFYSGPMTRCRDSYSSAVAADEICINKMTPPPLFAQLQNIDLEEEVSHAGQVVRTQRQRCLECRRPGWGPRLEEMGHAFVHMQLECWQHYNKRNRLLHNCATAVREIEQILENARQEESDLSNELNGEPYPQKRQLQGILYSVHGMLQRFRAAPYLQPRQRQVLARLEIAVDRLYGEASASDDSHDFGLAVSQSMEESADSPGSSLQHPFDAGNDYNGTNAPRYASVCNNDSEKKDGDFGSGVDGTCTGDTTSPWRLAGVYRYRLSSDSVYQSDQPYLENWKPSLVAVKEELEHLRDIRHLVHSPGRYRPGPQEDPNHLGEVVPPLTPNRNNEFFRKQRGPTTDMFMDDPWCSLYSALCVLREPRSILVAYHRILYPGKVVRRPHLPLSTSASTESVARETQNTLEIVNSSVRNAMSDFQDHLVYFMLQDAGVLRNTVVKSGEQCLPLNDYSSYDFSLSLRRYLFNIPHLGLGLRFPICIDKIGSAALSSQGSMRLSYADLDASSVIVPLVVPAKHNARGVHSSPTENDSTEPATEDHGGGNVGNANNHMAFALGAGRLLRAPRLLNFIWSLPAQLGLTINDVDRNGASVFVNRQLIIALQWVSTSLVAGPLFWTLLARSVRWIPCKPVQYQLQDLPYEIKNEMRFLNEHECGQLSVILVMAWLFLGRRTERMTSRDFFRAMREHVFVKHSAEVHCSRAWSFLQRLGQRYQRQWDEICPQFLQKLSFTPHWNLRSHDDLLKHIAFWHSQDLREHRSVFRAVAGRGNMFCERRWDELVVREESSSRKMLIAALVALASFSSSTPHFWINLVTVFICSIGLGLSTSLHTLQTGVGGAMAGQTRSLLKSFHLVTLIIFAFLVGQLLGSSGGILFLAEFVVTSISFLLGGAGTISASSVESWGIFFLLSFSSFWGYLFGRVAAVDGILRHRNHHGTIAFSSVLLSTSVLVALLLWIFLFVWRWDVPVSLVVLRHSAAKAARAGGATSAGVGASRSTAIEYASKHLQ